MLRFGKENITRVADLEIKDARKRRDGGIAHFKGDKGMADMYRADCRDRIKAARLAKKGKFLEARSVISGMDTGARDEVTDEFWNLIMDITEEVVL